MEPRFDSPADDLTRTLAPTMLIGLGGTGTDVLLRVRRLFYERYGTAGFPIVGYLALDTNKNAFSQLKGENSELVMRKIALRPQADVPEAIDCSITQQQFDDYFTGRARQHPHIFDRWMPDNMDQYGSAAIVEGAGQNRPFGRLGFFHHFHAIRDAIKRRLLKITAEASLPHHMDWLPRDAVIDAQRLEVVLVYSLAGGTGAGMFLDTSLLVRHMVQKELHLTGVQPRFTHFAVLPEAFVQHVALDDDMRAKIQENAFTCLREMEYFAMKRTAVGGGVSGQPFDLSIPPPVPADDFDRPAVEPLYRVQWERSGPEVEIHGCPWNRCYLVGGGNDPMGGAALTPGELDQMIAERLFLDFDPSQFGQCRRPLDSNLEAGALTRMEIPVPNEQGDELYHYSVSRRFSIFGLSQLFFDRTRMRRAASYRLAAQLVDYWLRAKDVGPAVIEQEAHKDVLGGTRPDLKRGATPTVTETHEPGDVLLPISCDALLGQVLLENREHDGRESYWDKLKKDADELRHALEDGRVDVRSEENLRELQQKHERLVARPPVGEPGVGLKTFRLNREALLREIEARFRCLFRYRLRKHGLQGALEFFERYNIFLEEDLKQAQTYQREAPVLAGEWVERLREACRLPWPFRRPAARIEQQRALRQVHRYAYLNYRQRAMEDVRACLEGAHHCVSIRDEQSHSYHTLLKRFRTALNSQAERGEGVRQYLQKHFDRLSKQDATQSRTIGLLAKWEDTDKQRHYDDCIKKIIPTDSVDQRIDWPQVEEQVWRQLRESGKPRWADVKQLGDLAVLLCRPDSPAPALPASVEEFGRDLAEACEGLLRGFARDISALSRFDEEGDPRNKARYLDTLRMYSSPFLRKNPAVDLPRDAVKTSIALLGITDSASARAQQFRQKLIETGGPHDAALRETEPFDTPDDAVVLYQEKVGVPLCAYAGLDGLGALYDRSNRKRETYIDRRLEGKLPEIRKINQRRELASSVEPILFGIISGVLKYEQDNFWLPLRHGQGGAIKRPLGGQFEDVIKHCGQNRQILEQLQKQFQAWRERAADRDDGQQLALLWCATQDFKEEIRQRVQAHLNRTQDLDRLDLADHPLLSILGKRMLPRLRRWLEGLPNDIGQRWLDSPLDLDGVVNDPNLTEQDKGRLLQERRDMLEGGYSLIDPESMPIPVLHAEARIRPGTGDRAPEFDRRPPSPKSPRPTAP